MLLPNLVIILTLADWSVLINALMAGLMIGYGFWIHHIVKEQEKLKDATIQALQAALTAKEAEISRLTSDTAPNIVKAYQGMREHADKMTADLMELQEKLRKAQEKERPQTLVSEALGLNLGYKILLDKFEKYIQPPTNEPPTFQLRRIVDKLRESILETFEATSKEIDIRLEEVREFKPKD